MDSKQQADEAGTIGIRIRHENQERGKFFTRWPIADLDNVIPMIGRWGLRDDDKSVEISEADLAGQFVISDGHIYFEVMIGDLGVEVD
jgi:hypothetical protein